ncbi:hypothetical protein A9179_18680 [Pseudomonas alcaligenes]|uniref:Solute-binding protein family 3/N-terminal domain-containing protein n=1 Tax=Aquipseudomonas alcaligenes TaxID=43263 RepID=A0ABR7S6S3_AQUAC|nr:amino acid ABC transporter substrate-binding protein [Pseudomonas alcaligenes]MBC9252301.1 hypothetical protein [Pseudomonas alcaligenes]
MKRLLPLLLCLPLLAEAQTLERIRSSQQLNIGYQANLAPFSSTLDGQPRGYAIELCQQVVEQIRQQPGFERLQQSFRALDTQEGLEAVRDGSLDLFCGATSETLERRGQVSFSVPIYAAGRGVVVRRDAPQSLVQALNGGGQQAAPQWRANIARVLGNHRFLVLKGSTTEIWARERVRELGLAASIRAVDNLREGMELLDRGQADAFFSDRVLMHNWLASSGMDGRLQVLDRLFDLEPMGLVLARGDEDFRLLVDTTLSRLYRSGRIESIYGRYFGPPSEPVKLLFRAYAPR